MSNSLVCPKCKLLVTLRIISTIQGNIIMCPECNHIHLVTKTNKEESTC